MNTVILIILGIWAVVFLVQIERLVSSILRIEKSIEKIANKKMRTEKSSFIFAKNNFTKYEFYEI